MRASGALSLQRKKGPEYRRQRHPFSPRENVHPVCPDPASALGPRISPAQCRDWGNAGRDAARIPSVPVSLLKKVGGKENLSLVRSQLAASQEKAVALVTRATCAWVSAPSGVLTQHYILESNE